MTIPAEKRDIQIDPVRLIEDLYDEIESITGSAYCQEGAEDDVMERAKQYLAKRGILK